MKKVLNNIENIVDEMCKGIVAANPGLALDERYRIIKRKEILGSGDLNIRRRQWPRAGPRRLCGRRDANSGSVRRYFCFALHNADLQCHSADTD